MVIPLYTDDPLEGETKPFVTWGLIAVNFIVFMVMLALPQDSQESLMKILGFVPATEMRSTSFSVPFPRDLTLISYMFVHANAEHILGNMLFLWIFGDDIEDALGHVRFLIFYVVCGIAGGVVFLLYDPHSALVLVGASGAISGVLTAFLMLRPCAKIEVLAYIWPIGVHAMYFIGLWIALQLWNAASQSNDDVAYWDHVGGIVAGVALILVMRPSGLKLFECMWPTKKWDMSHGRTRWWAWEHVLALGITAIALLAYVGWLNR